MRLLLNRLQWDVLRRHVGPFAFSFLTVMFLLLMQFLMLHIDKLVGKGIPFPVILELIVTNLAYMVVLAAPMAVLVATVMAFGRFSELNELTALRAAGVNPVRVLNPALVASLLLAVFLAWFSNDVLPDANQRARSLFIDIQLKKPSFDLEPHEFYEGIEGYTFLVKRMPSETDSLYDVTLFQEPGKNRDRAVIKAKRGLLQSEDDHQTLTLNLFDGSIMHYMITERDRKDMVEETDFDRYRISFDLSDLLFTRSNEKQHSRSDRTMSSRAMLAVVDTLKNEIDKEIKKNSRSSSELVHPPGKNAPFQGRNQKKQPDTTKAKNLPETPYVAVNMLNKKSHRSRLIQETLNDLRYLQSNYENLSVNVNWRTQRIAKFMVEVYKKFSIPFACVAFLLIGAPIGMLTRKGNLGFAALVSAGLLTFYWISIIQGEKLADRLYISPFMGMWFSDILLSVVGILLIIRINTSFRFSKLWRKKNRV